MKTLPSVRLKEQTLDNVHAALDYYNKNNLVKLSLAEFRRLSYEVFAQFILKNKLDELNIQLEK